MSAGRWGDAAFTSQLAQVQWMACPMVALHLNERSTGTPARDWLTAWAPRFFPGGDLRVLVLGCGEGWLERALARRPRIVRIDAMDAAGDAVARAREIAASQGLSNISYRVADLNTEALDGTWDVIIAHSVLHHVERLEHAFDEIARALAANGILLINEYVGPRRFQYGDEVHQMINELLRAIPERFRRGTIQPGTYAEKRRATEQEIVAADPTEAVRSDELLPMIASRFRAVDRIDLGGTLLQHLLYDIVPNFRFDDSLARSIVELLCICEGALVDAQAIPSDYVLIAARKGDASPLPPGRTSAHRRSWLHRASQVALLANVPNRPMFNPRSAVADAVERVRDLLRHDSAQSAFNRLLARLPEGSEIAPLIEAIERIAIRHAL